MEDTSNAWAPTTHVGDPDETLPSALSNPSCCGHMGNEAESRDALSPHPLSLSLFCDNPAFQVNK